ncbi:DUF2280 domain-containing protein [Delftia acidovorans]|uniref:DUF2280 domain-containing protein n=1 Tax=Delftia acidovorans TaxID=80866 RepID=UPI003018B017
MAKLSEAEKRFIVQALACYDTPTQVVEAVKEEFGTALDRGHVGCYDPTKVAGKQLAKKWRDVFFATRDAFKNEITEIPIAQRSYRLKVLQRIVSKAESMKNMPLALQVLEQAAKECGDMYVNRKPLDGDGKGGEAPQPVKVVVQVQDASADADR